MSMKILAASALALTVIVAGCEKEDANKAADKAKSAAADATKAVGDAAKKTADATKDAAKATADATKDAAKATSDATKDAAKTTADATKAAADATKSAIDAAAASAGKWISDTVEKQWPEAKKTLDAATAKIAEIKDAANKTKAEGISKDLKAQIPTIEEAVAKLKTATGADSSKMLTEVKAKFDGWMGKLTELKGLVGMK
ncbi:MAG: hypothetical protein JSR77_07610 [Planctomycetes bacterium]|nr:hypothetical protein [Planctomycetota bacterium]